jgi:hypothetical protein
MFSSDYGNVSKNFLNNEISLLVKRGKNMMKRNAALFAVCLLVVCFMTVSVQPVQAASEVVIVSHFSFYTMGNMLYIVGEVENTGDVATEFTKINATLYDAEDQFVDTIVGYASLDVLLPGRKSPFYVMMSEADGSLSVDDYSLAISWTDCEEGKEIGLEIISSESSIDALDYFHVTGEIQNIGTETATAVTVCTTFYDAEGTVIGRDWDVGATDLEPNQIATFDSTLIYDELIEQVASYSVTAESENYALIPEFSVGTTMIAVLAVIALAVLVCTKKLQTQK